MIKKRANSSAYNWYFLNYFQKHFGGKFEFTPVLKRSHLYIEVWLMFCKKLHYSNDTYSKIYETYAVASELCVLVKAFSEREKSDKVKHIWIPLTEMQSSADWPDLKCISFETLYFLKFCPIFGGSLQNLCYRCRKNVNFRLNEKPESTILKGL